MTRDFSLETGRRLRSVRLQQGLSLTAVQEKSGGRWKAVVIGSYERADRGVTVESLSELAHFYHVPIIELLPAPTKWYPPPVRHLRFDLLILAALDQAAAAPLARYLDSIRLQRGDYNGKVLTIRATDLQALAIVYDTDTAELAQRFIRWHVLDPDSIDIPPTE